MASVKSISKQWVNGMLNQLISHWLLPTIDAIDHKIFSHWLVIDCTDRPRIKKLKQLRQGTGTCPKTNNNIWCKKETEKDSLTLWTFPFLVPLILVSYKFSYSLCLNLHSEFLFSCYDYHKSVMNNKEKCTNQQSLHDLKIFGHH